MAGMLPCIPLHEEGALRISFDLLGGERSILACKLIHCNADWQPSSLSPMEAMESSLEGELLLPRSSTSTRQPFQHYELELSQSSIRFRYSGNYLLHIYDPISAEDAPLLSLPILVSEQRGGARLSVSPYSRLGEPSRTQQFVSCDLSASALGIEQEDQELRIVVLQNGRWESRQSYPTIRASLIDEQQAYHREQVLAFEGGAEYYRLEHTDDLETTVGVVAHTKDEGLYHLQASTRYLKASAPYVYDADLDGREIIHSTSEEQTALRIGYHEVHFELMAESPLQGQVVLEGGAFDHLPWSSRTFAYDPVRHSYRLSLLLKAGYQEYQMSLLDTKMGIASAIPIMGNHSETTNTYSALVYLRDPQTQTDRLIDLVELRYIPIR